MRGRATALALAALTVAACAKDKPIDRDLPRRRASEEPPTRATAEPPLSLVEIDDGGAILLDGVHVGSTAGVAASRLVAAFDQVISRFSERHKEQQLAAPRSTDHGIVRLRLRPDTSGSVLTSALAALGGAYQRLVRLEVQGAPEIYEIHVEQAPGLDGPDVLHVVRGAGAWSLEWSLPDGIHEDYGADVTDGDLPAELCKAYRAPGKAGHGERVVIHAPGGAPVADMVKSFAAVSACGPTPPAIYVQP